MCLHVYSADEQKGFPASEVQTFELVQDVAPPRRSQSSSLLVQFTVQLLQHFLPKEETLVTNVYNILEIWRKLRASFCRDI